MECPFKEVLWMEDWEHLNLDKNVLHVEILQPDVLDTLDTLNLQNQFYILHLLIIFTNYYNQHVVHVQDSKYLKKI